MLWLIATALVGAIVAWFFFGGGSNSGAKPVAPRAASPKGPVAAAAAAIPPSGPRVKIIFGSQTGTAEMFAKTLVRQGTKLGVPCQIADIEDYTGNALCDEQLVIFVVATYGEGEPTDTMKNFHDWLLETTEDLSALKFAVFGLGDRQYKHFCQMGVDFDRRLSELGAQRVYGLGQGDAGRDIEEEFDAWSKELWPCVGAKLGIELKADVEEPVAPELVLKFFDQEPAPLPFPKMASALEPTQKLPVYATVTQNVELLNGGSAEGRSTRHIVLDIGETLISYQAGDHLGVLPQNPASVVDDYLRILGVEDPERVVSLQDKNFKNSFPARVTIRTVFTWYLDLCGVPKKSTLRGFAFYCEDPAEKEELLRLLRVNPESQEQFKKLLHKLRTVFGFLRKFKSCRVPLGHFLELMPRMTPRYFSISSDQLRTPKELHITVAVVEGGVCTTMLAQSDVGTRIPVFVRKSNFHLPLRHKTKPVVMIGPGTGVAPLIGFCHRRIAWKAKGNEIGDALLFFGCRRRDEDFLYREFLEGCLDDRIITSLDVAFSREQHDKVYVQHRIAARAEELWALVQQGAYIYICGDAKHMAKDVDATLLRIFSEQGGLSPADAEALIEKMTKEEKLLKDVWSA